MGNTPSIVPSGAHIDQINIPLKCNTAQYFDTYPTVVSATAPIYGNPNTQVYFSDIYAHFSLPDKFYDWAVGNGSDHYTASVEITWSGGANARNDDFTVNNTWDHPTIDIAAKPFSVVLPANGTAQLYLQNVFISTKALYPNGSVAWTIGTNCFAMNVVWVVSSIAVTTSYSGGAQYAPANGFEGRFPSISSGQKASVVNIPVTCNNGLNTNVIYGGIGPAAVKTNTKFSLSSFTSYFVLPGSLVQELAPIDSGIFVTLTQPTNGENVTGSGLVLGLQDSSPQFYDLSRDFTASEATPNPLNTGAYVAAGTNDPIRFGLPRTGSLSTTAVSGGLGVFGVNATVLNAIVSSYSLETGELTNWRLYTCSFPPHLLLGAPVSSGSPI